MWIWIIGFALIGIGIMLWAYDDYDIDDIINPIGFVMFLGGCGCIIWGIFTLGDDKQKAEVKADIVADSTQVHVTPDSIYAVQYVITWKDDKEIKCGSDIILKGKTEKSVGDTITINLK